jgi:hypothetical protein
MNLDNLIAALKEERDRLDEVILNFERLEAMRAGTAKRRPPVAKSAS